ncbi:hypothetical protein RRG08_041345 [Elysia crispata]|uniref:Uncharacterized protein n=1 Tax=Elysia crispata TaxID=231223 RepID=A0AAE1D4Y1_9GAST|nr:hypothetical protein RRG08_041328 [Elysia crispata]KAK3802647.1 hypothetical protein RRG08_041345 [Elysia crispata]
MAPLVGLRVEASRTLSSGVWGGNHYGDVRTTWSDTRFSDWEPRAPWFESLVEKLGGGVSEHVWPIRSVPLRTSVWFAVATTDLWTCWPSMMPVAYRNSETVT